MTDRKTLPLPTKLEVLLEAAYRCGNPRCSHILTLEIHHIVWVKDGGGSAPANLLALCPNCHSLHTAGHIPQEAIRHWKGMLTALNCALDRPSIDLLLFLTKQRFQATYYSADGLLRFAGLIAAGLVDLGAAVGGGLVMGRQVSTSVHQVALSEKGRLLVETWLSGDEEGYRRIVSQDLSDHG